MNPDFALELDRDVAILVLVIVGSIVAGAYAAYRARKIPKLWFEAAVVVGVVAAPPVAAPLLDEPLPAYFSMLMMGFIVAISVAVIWALRTGVDHESIIDLGLVCLITGVAGARILHVFVDGYFMDYVHLCTDYTQVEWPLPRAQCTAEIGGAWDAAASVCRPVEGDCLAWAKFWNGGLVWYGGLIGASIAGIWFLKREGLPVAKAVDMTGYAIPLGVFFGRLGCWFGGCCFGVRSDSWLAVRFPAWSPASEKQFREHLLDHPGHESLAVLPAQLFEAVGCLSIAAFCMIWLHPRKRFDGQVFIVSMALYAVLRFFLEFIRADDRGGVLGISTSQWIGLAVVAGMGVVYARFQKRAKAKLAEPLPAA